MARRGNFAGSHVLVAVYLSVAVPFVVIDPIWLKLLSQRVYVTTMGNIARSEPNLWPAILFYILYPVGLISLAVMPAHRTASGDQVAMIGLPFGFFTYATYDLTNRATLYSWTPTLSVVDIA